MVRHSRRIYGVFLAAGRSSRMGCPKLELPFRGGTVGSTSLAAACASSLEGILVVTEYAGEISWLRHESSSALDLTRFQSIPCKDAARGQSYSLQCGVRAAQRLGAEAIVVLLADQPLLTPTAIDVLLDEYHNNAKANARIAYIAASCEDSGVPMPPVLFHHTIFPELFKLTGDQGARTLLRGPNEREGVQVGFRDADLFLDIDTPEDYTYLIRRTSAGVDSSG